MKLPTIILLAGLVLPCHAHSADVTVTAFLARKNDVTGMGTNPVPGYTLAVSRDMMRRYFGRQVTVSWKGGKVTGYVESVTHHRLHRTVDVLVRNLSEAKRIGKAKGKIRLS